MTSTAINEDQSFKSDTSKSLAVAKLVKKTSAQKSGRKKSDQRDPNYARRSKAIKAEKKNHTFYGKEIAKPEVIPAEPEKPTRNFRDEPIFPTMPEQEVDTNFRKVFQKKIGKSAVYTPVFAGTKRAYEKFNLTNRKYVPMKDNFGVVPQGDLFVLDLDLYKGGFTVDQQAKFFSHFFGVDIRESFSVATQTGGVHVYLRFPAGFEKLTKDEVVTGSLRGHAEAFREVSGLEPTIDADIRTSYSSGYVVGPNCFVTFEGLEGKTEKPLIRDFYRVATDIDGFSKSGIDAEILTITKQGFENYVALKETSEIKKAEAKEADRLEKKAKKEARKALNDSIAGIIGDQTEDTIEEDTSEISGVEVTEDPTDAMPSSKIVTRLEDVIEKLNLVTYHRKRAYVKSALQCCHTDSVIATVCSNLNYDRDTSSQSSISYEDLIDDLGRIHTDRVYHGGFCAKGVAFVAKQAFNSETLQELIESNADRVATRTIARRNRYTREIDAVVVDIAKVSKALLKDSKRKTPAQQYFDAMAIVDYFVQPLSNAGAQTMLLARAAIEERLELTSSRSSQALRKLRESGVIVVKHKQKTGMSATYQLSPNFIHHHLTTALRMAWGFNGVPSETADGTPRKFHASIYIDRSAGGFKEVFTGKAIQTNFPLIATWISRMNEAAPAQPSASIGAGAALSYLKEEAEHRGLKVLGGFETIVFDETSGEIVSETSETSGFDGIESTPSKIDEELEAIIESKLSEDVSEEFEKFDDTLDDDLMTVAISNVSNNTLENPSECNVSEVSATDIFKNILELSNASETSNSANTSFAVVSNDSSTLNEDLSSINASSKSMVVKSIPLRSANSISNTSFKTSRSYVKNITDEVSYINSEIPVILQTDNLLINDLRNKKSTVKINDEDNVIDWSAKGSEYRNNDMSKNTDFSRYAKFSHSA